jgi:leader peptidase (prepilin peptidase)/N-methyltransferase
MQIFIAVILGLVLGSFATAVTYRENNDISWGFSRKKPEHPPAQRSTCTHCQTILSPRDLIPVFSWVINKGKCTHCGAPIGWVYPATEIATVLGCIVIVIIHGLSFYAVTLMFLLPFLISLTIIDFKKMILPDTLVLITAGIGMLSLTIRTFMGQIAFGDMIIHLISGIGYGLFALALGSLLSAVLKKDALGMGDVKFFAAAGLWLGPLLLADFCFLSGVLGMIIGLIWKATTKSTIFPFGPALILSFFTLLLIDGSFLLQFTLK